VLAGDISARQDCAPTTMLAGDNCMCQQSIFHVSAQIVFGQVLITFKVVVHCRILLIRTSQDMVWQISIMKYYSWLHIDISCLQYLSP
jgi:hypothetical protein